MKHSFPVITVVLAIMAIWYLGAVLMNATWERDQAERAEVEITWAEIIPKTMAQERPILPAPHQVATEIWETVAEKKITSKRSLVYHGWVTLSATLLGFALGSALGVVLAIGIVGSRTMDISVMPWIIASQMVPILAIAPMMIVVLNAAEVGPLFAKATISMYLSFFPVVVGMVKGLRSPDALQMDLMRTYSASVPQTFIKLRLPASLPWLFTSMKVGVAASLVGAIVAEMTLSQDGGLGSRLLNGSYYGQTMMIWAALIASAALAGGLIPLIGGVQRIAMRGRPS